MSKTNRIISVVIIVLVIAFGIWYWSSRSTPIVSSQGLMIPAPVQPTGGTLGSAAAPMSATVSYTASGFSPSTVTIKQGGTVTFQSTDGSRMWVASDPHPSHTGYSGTTKQQHCPDVQGIAFDQCSIGPTYTFTFQKIGSWGYHNHTSANDGGTVIVVQ